MADKPVAYVSSFSAHAPWSLTKHKFKDEIIQNVKTTAEHFNKGRILPNSGPWMTAKVHAHDIDPEPRYSSLKFISVFWFTQTHVHQVGDAIQPSHPLSSPSPPAPNPSQHQGLVQCVNSLHEVAKVLEFQLQHQSFSEHPGLISFRMDWLDLLAVQGTLKSLLQHHSSKASILQCSIFFTLQLSHPYMTTGKTI